MGIKSQLLTAVLGASVCAGSVFAVTPQSVEAAAARPDIVMVMVDDLGFVTGNSVTDRLSHVNQIRTQGVQVLATDQSPLCGPNRAGLYTGLYPGQHGTNSNNGGELNWNESVFRVTKDAGYHVGVFGKVINNPNQANVRSVTNEAFLFYDSKAGGPAKLRSKSVNFVNNAPQDKPMFLSVLPTAPHSKPGSYLPHVEQEYRWASACNGIGNFRPPTYKPGYNPEYPFNMPTGLAKGWPLRDICKSLLPVNETVGAVLAAQEERGRDVYVFFVSDNGMAYGAKGYASKANPWSMRSVLFVKGPGIKPGKVNANKQVSTMDIGSTIADIAGTSMPWAKGKSFLPLLKGQKYNSRKYLYECFPHPDPKISFVAVRFVNEKGEQYRVIRYGSGKTITTEPSWQPFELTDLKKKMSWLTKTLSDKAKSWARGNCRMAL